ncbi:MAG: DUF2628 domain-containing protein [Hyphomicrobium sp.]
MPLLTFTVHEPPDAGADRIDRASELRFVKDGFSWVTALFPPFGLAMSQLWLPLAAYLVFTGAAVAALAALGVSETSITTAVIALQVFMGFEHSSLQRWSLDNDGWQMLGTVTGKTLDECERRFFESWLPGQPMIAQPGSSSTGAEAISAGVAAHAWRSPWSRLGSKA